VTGPRIVRSSRPEFEAATLAAVSEWRFDAGRKDGRMVNTRAMQSVQFLLKDGPPSPPPDWF
jgi:outer membrane biosynthesis protein TonB